MAAPGHGGWEWARQRGSGTRGRCYPLGEQTRGGEVTPDPGAGEAEARFKAGLKDVHEFRRPCLPFIPQTTSGSGG